MNYFHGEKLCGDNFVVEDLLDLSNEDDDNSSAGVDGGSLSAVGFATAATAVDSCSNCVSGGPDSNFSGLSGDLCEPYDELAELEWLSNFVEESFSSEDIRKLQLISRPNLSLFSTSQNYDTTSQLPLLCPEASVPGKARSKRSRVAPCNWSSHLLLHQSRKRKKKAFEEESLQLSDGCQRCSHCSSEKTPQWRTGPMGAKTLCNACGVRFKSGRLVPEYRPAASPTFVASKHSNSHRKVVELRRQKEMQGVGG